MSSIANLLGALRVDLHKLDVVSKFKTKCFLYLYSMCVCVCVWCVCVCVCVLLFLCNDKVRPELVICT